MNPTTTPADSWGDPADGVPPLSHDLTSASPAPPSGCDANGRLLPISEEEQRVRAEAFARMIDEWRDLPEDDPPGSYEDALRGIDEGRPHRKLFQGMY
jgi:hypothetical protein